MNIIKRFFSKNLDQTLNKIKQKRTVFDMKKLNHFLNDTVKNNKVVSKINKTARLDDDFSNFLNDFKSKNKSFPNIIDLSRFNDESENYNSNSKKLDKEEKEILEEFKKRAFEKRENKLTQNDTKNLDIFSEISNETILNMKDFVFMIMERKSTTNITRLNRINTMHTTVFCGNGDGVIGYGKGKGMDFEVAMKNALDNCTKNIVTINYDYLNSFVENKKKRFMSVTMEMYRRKYFESWGSPIVGSMIQLAGITNCGFKLIYRKPRYLAITYLYFQLITKNKTPKMLAEESGKKIFDLGFAKGSKAWDTNHLRL